MRPSQGFLLCKGTLRPSQHPAATVVPPLLAGLGRPLAVQKIPSFGRPAPPFRAACAPLPPQTLVTNWHVCGDGGKVSPALPSTFMHARGSGGASALALQSVLSLPPDSPKWKGGKAISPGLPAVGGRVGNKGLKNGLLPTRPPFAPLPSPQSVQLRFFENMSSPCRPPRAVGLGMLRACGGRPLRENAQNPSPLALAALRPPCLRTWGFVISRPLMTSYMF